MFLTAPAHAEDMVTAADNGPVAGIDSAQGAGVPTQINGDTGIVRKIINIFTLRYCDYLGNHVDYRWTEVCCVWW